MTKILLLVISFILMVYGITYIIMYINLLAFGYTIKEYMIFLFGRIEGYLLPSGILLEIIGLNIRKGKTK